MPLKLMAFGIGRIKNMKKILLPLDGSETSLKALIPAKSLAGIMGAGICILHVSDEKMDEKICISSLGIKKERLGCFVVLNRIGDPAKVILEESERYDCIVMSTHGKTCDTYRRAGSVAIEVLENTYKPVLLVRPDIEIKCNEEEIWIPQKVLVPLNGAPNSAQALVPAMKIVAKTHASIDLLHIPGQKKEDSSEEVSYTTPYYVDYPQHEWDAWSKEFVRRFCPILTNHNNINFKLSYSYGDPGEEILNFARENKNDFIVMAWHGTFSKFRASVLKKVLLETPCPIMLIKIK